MNLLKNLSSRQMQAIKKIHQSESIQTSMKDPRHRYLSYLEKHGFIVALGNQDGFKISLTDKGRAAYEQIIKKERNTLKRTVIDKDFEVQVLCEPSAASLYNGILDLIERWKVDNANRFE